MSTKDRNTLILSAVFCAALFIARVYLTGSIFFAFLFWNLFLALMPLFFSQAFQNKPERFKGLKGLFLFSSWLLFLPNSFYIITDLIHFKERDVHIWLDLFLIFSFAWTGIMMGVHSIRQMQATVFMKWGSKAARVFPFPVLFLCAIGVYIGRFMRYNSWDILTNPLLLVKDVVYLCLHPFRHFIEWGTIGCMAILISIIFFSHETRNKKQETSY